MEIHTLTLTLAYPWAIPWGFTIPLSFSIYDSALVLERGSAWIELVKVWASVTPVIQTDDKETDARTDTASIKNLVSLTR